MCDSSNNVACSWIARILAGFPALAVRILFQTGQTCRILLQTGLAPQSVGCLCCTAAYVFTHAWAAEADINNNTRGNIS
jgi:hypothetical protein